MCRTVRVLTPSEQKEAARLTGILLPVYASIVLAIFAGLYLARSETGTMIAAAPDAAREIGTGTR